MDPSEINLLDPDCFVKGVPHEWFTWLRRNAPVYKHSEPNVVPASGSSRVITIWSR